MKVLFYGINYAPELTGIGKYSGEMAAYSAELGHDVRVITAPPYYPEWSVWNTYRGKGWHTEIMRGVQVHRCPLYVPKQVTGLKRIIHEATFLVSSLRYWVPAYFRKLDVIVVVSPPFHLVFLALIHKLFHGTRVVNHIQDLQVDAARDLGIIKNEPLLRTLEWMEKFLLKRVDYVSTISSGMINKVEEKGIPRDNTIFFPNWVDNKVVYPVSPAESMRSAWGYAPTDQLVLYSGNLGEKQGLDIILELADRLQSNPRVKFLIVGDGGVKEQLMAKAATMKLTNLRFAPLQPLEKLSASLAAADVHLVLQKKAAADLVLPSKLTNILATGGHALVTADPGTTLYDVVKEHALGTVVAAENTDALYRGLEEILSGSRAEDARGAVEYARKYLNKEEILDAFLRDIS